MAARSMTLDPAPLARAVERLLRMREAAHLSAERLSRRAPEVA